MTEPEDIDEDLFADLYEGDASIGEPFKTTDPVPPATAPAPQVQPAQIAPAPPALQLQPHLVQALPQQEPEPSHDQDPKIYDTGVNATARSDQNGDYNTILPRSTNDHGFSGTVGIKEDGKMFIGGLNWETTDQSLRDYFTQFGAVIECTVMRDGATGRSRGFGFLTFRDPKTVNTVMVKEHYLDGKIIDPKRAIPRDEQEKTSKIFVGGVSQDATERQFEEYFAQFGRVIDATLMMDKDTGRPRGFGFVTFEGEAAVEATLAQPLEILGKPIEVKKAQPRGNIRDDDDGGRGKFGRRGGQNDRFQRHNNSNNNQDYVNDNQGPQGQQGAGGVTNGMSPQMMAQYWQRMQQYFAMMQQQMTSGMAQGGMQMGGGGMNPAMMQQMMAMQQMQRGQSPGTAANGQNMGGMNPAMMQQMQQMQQMQMLQQQQQQGQSQGGYPSIQSPMGDAAGRPGYNAQEQMAFEQRKYEQQQGQGSPFPGQGQGLGSAGQNWEGVYDETAQAGGARGGPNGSQPRGSQPPTQPSQAPANAPTGPKNAGRPGANYRGGGRGSHRGFHPYSRG